MRPLILIAAIILAFWSQDEYHDGNTFGAASLLLLAVLIVYVCGYLLGLETGEETAKDEASPYGFWYKFPPDFIGSEDADDDEPDEDEPKVGGTGA